MWKESPGDAISLTTTKQRAGHWAQHAYDEDTGPDGMGEVSWPSEVSGIVLEIDTSQLDPALFRSDPITNLAEDISYYGTIPPEALRVVYRWDITSGSLVSNWTCDVCNGTEQVCEICNGNVGIKQRPNLEGNPWICAPCFVYHKMDKPEEKGDE